MKISDYRKAIFSITLISIWHSIYTQSGVSVKALLISNKR